MAGKVVRSKCWDCSRAVGKDRCCWAAGFKPVPGWTAEPTVITSRDKRWKNHGIGSYHVIDCPQFVKDGRPAIKAKAEEIDPDAVDRLRYDIVVFAIRDWLKANAVLTSQKQYSDDQTGQPMTNAKAARTIRECENFFRSSWFEMLRGINGEFLIKTLRDGNVPKLSFFTKAGEEQMERRVYLTVIKRTKKRGTGK